MKEYDSTPQEIVYNDSPETLGPSAQFMTGMVCFIIGLMFGMVI